MPESTGEDLKKAKAKALSLLMHMDRTEAKLRTALLQRGYSEEVTDQALEYVKQLHYVDDARYARVYVENRADKKSRAELKRDLRKKGVPEDMIGQALEDVETEDEKSAVLRLLKKRGFDARTADQKEAAKQYRYLMNRGFSYGDIRDAMKECRVPESD